MSSVERAYATQLANIQKKTGKSLEELASIIQSSGLTKHSEIRSMLMEKYGLGYGDATQLTHYVNKTNAETAAKEKGLTTDQVLNEIYAGPKASLRPIHDKLMDVIEPLGDYEIAPKKGYISLRRKRQFAMLGPATNTRFELGLNIKNLEADERLIEQPAGSMCNYKIRLTDVSQVDEAVINWVRRAYQAAG
jgi:hypothetical protein